MDFATLRACLAAKPGASEDFPFDTVTLTAKVDALAKKNWMAKQKFRPTRLGGFSGAKAYIR